MGEYGFTQTGKRSNWLEYYVKRSSKLTDTREQVITGDPSMEKEKEIFSPAEGMASDVSWEAEKIHLNDRDLRQLPDHPLCNKLVELIMRGPSLSVIPDTFFENMPVLKVLDLSNTNIVSLPNSISSLTMLEELFLKDCSALIELPTEIETLSKLKVFDINGTELMFIPEEMGKLKELELLRVSLSRYAKYYIQTINSVQTSVIPREVISALNKLKELCVTINVGEEKEWWEEEVEDLQKELCGLHNLETLRWYLPTQEALEEFLLLEINDAPIYKKLSNMVLTIGQHAQLTSCLPDGLEKKFREFKNCLNWINAEGNEDDISKIIERTEALFLHRHWTIEKLSTFNITNLKYCLVAECNEMETFMEGDGLIGEVIQYLSIHHMNKLRSIWNGPIGKDSLSRLTVLALHTCTQLTSVFSPTIAQNLSCLTELIVEDCPKVTSLVRKESHMDIHSPIFPALDRIFLLDLPELVSIFDGLAIEHEISTLLIYSCLKLCLSIEELQLIKKIKGENEWWINLDYDISVSRNIIFEQLKQGRDLIEQLSEATNSLQHFHDSTTSRVTEYEENTSFESTAIGEQVITADTSMEKGKVIFSPVEVKDVKKQSEKGSTSGGWPPLLPIMASSSIQAGAGAVEAFSTVVDAALNLGHLTFRAVEAALTLETRKSRMEAKMVRLWVVKCSVEDKFRIYWLPPQQFQRWSSAVEVIISEVYTLEKSSPILVHSRTHMTKAIDAKGTEIDKLIEEGKDLEDALVKREVKRIVKLATPFNIENISALNEKLEQILQYLKDGSINTIRLYGSPGMGKRVLLQHVNNHEAIANMFDIVLWISASDYENHDKDYSIEAGIQLTIVRRLGLGIEGIKDVNFIASKIRTELDGTTYLLLLDDVKTDIDLETIGIPKNKNGSKIVFTTNLPRVRPFGMFFNIETGRLSNIDSWNMFEDILIRENDTIQQDEIKSIARKLLLYCDGIPILIKTVAENFKSRRSPESWSDGLQMLRRSDKIGDTYIKALVHMNYIGLEEKHKLCFLFSLLYPKDEEIPIDCLLDCWTAHKLIDSSGVSGQDILDSLLAKALLKEGSNEQYITIDKVIRAVAMKILHEQDQVKCLVAQKALEKIQSNDCKDAQWISLANSEIDDLPTKVHCSKLTTLFLQKNPKLKTISSSFFEHMESLFVLDLSKTGFDSVLPMSKLQSLKVLYLNGCYMLKELPFKIESFDHMLEVLDIRGCIIYEIPTDIKRLKHLRRLMVSIDGGDTPSHLLISELSSLKELVIDVTLDNVNNYGRSYMTWCNGVIEDTIKKIDNFKELTSFKFCFKDDIVDGIQVRGDTLKIFVPNEDSFQHIMKGRSHGNSSPIEVYIGFQMVSILEIPERFHSYDSFKEDLAKVKAHVTIQNSSVEHLDQIGISSSNMHQVYRLWVRRCNKIKTIMPIDGFSNLEILVVSECSQLKTLFSKTVAQHVMGIKHLVISACPAIEEINLLSTSGGDILPALETLVLYKLRMLTKICSDMEWPSLINLVIHECPKLTELPLNGNSANKLSIIEVERKWWGNLQLSDEIKQEFEPYCEFR
ncbi:hypothetical protein SSX86_005365 [Deinandra increscens subsp. villosa]|uniref:NB-ARC domain-containing protein n=1 Tax=Deinandra increscens subsp. villosa TaxID=3103831 RepID=A0AAP0DPR0_9ASTR